MNRVIETDRMILRKFETSDAESLFRLNADPEILKYTGDRPFQGVEEALLFLQNYSDYCLIGLGRWAVILKSNKEFVGWCGLKKMKKIWLILVFVSSEIIGAGDLQLNRHWLASILDSIYWIWRK